MDNCLFCKIVRGEIPSKKVYEDEHTFVFEDIDPKAPTHVLIVPKKHIEGLNKATSEDAEIIARGPRRRAMRSDFKKAKKFAEQKANQLANGETFRTHVTPAD